MSKFALRYPFFIIMLCMIVAVVGSVTVARMPVDLFPEIKIPVVVVATFYNGMPPEQIEANITNPFERFFTLGSGIDHIESRSLTGVSLIRVYFQPGTDADAAVTPSPIWPWRSCAACLPARCRRWCSSSMPPACRFA
jgi:multidrug efflux pump subunit AcrB